MSGKQAQKPPTSDGCVRSACEHLALILCFMILDTFSMGFGQGKKVGEHAAEYPTSPLPYSILPSRHE